MEVMCVVSMAPGKPGQPRTPGGICGLSAEVGRFVLLFKTLTSSLMASPVVQSQVEL